MSTEEIQLVNVVSANNSSSGSSPEPHATFSTFTTTTSSGSAAMSTDTFYTSSFSCGLRSYNRWAPSKQGATLVWRDVCVYTTEENGPNAHRLNNLKRIINNSTGAIQPGTLMAVMGASGAGKSTLMSALAYRNAAGAVVQGDILLNGRRVGPFMHRMSGFVHQDDLFIGTITVLEHITFMAHLRLDRRFNKYQKNKLIRDLLERTGLTASAHTMIGDSDSGKILSGGEKKRLAFATELLIKPTILFCDEPTTGLDSYSAQQLIQTLLSSAQQGTTIMCTIHQPSSQLFAMFHQVLLLAETGRIAFCGTPDQALDFFANNGYHCPPAYNPADFLIGVLANAPGYEKASQRAAHRLCDLFAVSEAAQRRDMLVNLEMHMGESSDFKAVDEVFYKPYWLVTMYWLCYRNLLRVVRDSSVQLVQIIQKIVLSIMLGLCYFGSVDLTQSGIQAVQGVLFVIIAENTFTPMYSSLSLFPQGFPLFIREKRSGLYDTVQYYLSHVIALIPGLFIDPIIFTVILYWLAGLNLTFHVFFMTVVLAIIVLHVSAACGFLFSIAFNSVPLALAFLVPFDLTLMITSGIFIRLSSMSAYLAWIKYLSWLMYANEAMTIVQWEGVTNITCVEDNTQLPCLKTADDIFEQYSFSTENFSMDLWALGILYISFNLLALFILWKRAKRLCQN